MENIGNGLATSGTRWYPPVYCWPNPALASFPAGLPSAGSCISPGRRVHRERCRGGSRGRHRARWENCSQKDFKPWLIAARGRNKKGPGKVRQKDFYFSLNGFIMSICACVCMHVCTCMHSFGAFTWDLMIWKTKRIFTIFLSFKPCYDQMLIVCPGFGRVKS